MLGLNKPNVKEFLLVKKMRTSFLKMKTKVIVMMNSAAMTKRVMASFPNASKLKNIKAVKENMENTHTMISIFVSIITLKKKEKFPMKFTVRQLNCLSLREKYHIQRKTAVVITKLLETIILVLLKKPIFMVSL